MMFVIMSNVDIFWPWGGGGGKELGTFVTLMWKKTKQRWAISKSLLHSFGVMCKSFVSTSRFIKQLKRRCMSNTTLPSKIAFLSFQNLAPFAPCLGGAGRATTPTLVNSWLHARIKKKKKKEIRLPLFFIVTICGSNFCLAVVIGALFQQLRAQQACRPLKTVMAVECSASSRGEVSCALCTVPFSKRIVLCVCVCGTHTQRREVNKREKWWLCFIFGFPLPFLLVVYFMEQFAHFFFFFRLCISYKILTNKRRKRSYATACHFHGFAFEAPNKTKRKISFYAKEFN